MKNITIIVPAGKDSKIEVLRDENRSKFNIIIERGPHPSENRNNGIKKANTRFIAFINAHTILSRNWAEEVKKFFKDYPRIDIVGGPQLNHEGESFFAKASGYALSSIFGTSEVRARYKKAALNLNADETQLTSANLICRRRVFKKIKFDENIYPGEDPKFISDAKLAGFKIAYSPKITNYNKRRTNLSSLAKQIFNYGITRPQKESFIETLKKPFFLVPSIFCTYLLFLPILFLFNLIFVIPLLFYLIFNILFSFFEGIKNRDLLSIFLLPLIFVTIHISYGLGFLISSITPRK